MGREEVEGWTGEGSEGWRGQWGSLGSEARRTGRKVVVWVSQSIVAYPPGSEARRTGRKVVVWAFQSIEAARRGQRGGGVEGSVGWRGQWGWRGPWGWRGQWGWRTEAEQYIHRYQSHNA